MASIETQRNLTAPLQRSVDRSTGIFTIRSLINTIFTSRVDIQPPAQFGGSFRIIPALNDNEASVVSILIWMLAGLLLVMRGFVV